MIAAVSAAVSAPIAAANARPRRISFGPTRNLKAVSLKVTKLPNVLLIADATLPCGAPPPFGFMISQNML